MTATLFRFFLLLSMYPLVSQEVLFEQKISLKTSLTDKRASLPIVNSTTGEVAIFLLDNYIIQGLLFNEKFELIDEFAADRPESTYKILLGHSVDSANYNLFFANEAKNRFFVKTINIKGKKRVGKQLSLKLRGEKFLESISYKGKFYLLTVKKNTSILKLYECTSDEISTTKQFDFSANEFVTGSLEKLYEVLDDDISPFKVRLKIQKIDPRNPNSIDVTTKRNKIYYSDDQLQLTLDNNLENTKLITIDLRDYSSKIRDYTQARVTFGDPRKIRSNSYLFDDNLFQIISSTEELCFQIKDLKNDSLRNQYRVNENEEISFSNTPVIQAGGMTYLAQGTERELEKTKQILRKISTSEIGITVNSVQQKLELTLGAHKEIERNRGGVKTISGTSISTPYGKVSTGNYHYSPTYYGYSKYVNSRSIYFKTVLDTSNFNHEKGNISENGYDKIRDFEKENGPLLAKAIFTLEDYYVFAYVKKQDKTFYLRKFKK